MREAVYGATSNYYPAMVAATKSLIANSAVDRVHWLIEDEEFPYDYPDDLITVHDVSGQAYFPEDGPNYGSRFTWMALMKCAVPWIIPAEKALWLDCDTVVMRDATPIWDTDLEGYCFAGVREPQKSAQRLYVNAGVLLMNLEELRKGKADEIISDLNARFRRFPEQDCIDALCHIKEIPGRWNATDFTAWAYDPIIHHYAAEDDWRFKADWLTWRHAPWDDTLRRHEMMVAKHG